jgi:hypothetical protein
MFEADLGVRLGFQDAVPCFARGQRERPIAAHSLSASTAMAENQGPKAAKTAAETPQSRSSNSVPGTRFRALRRTVGALIHLAMSASCQSASLQTLDPSPAGAGDPRVRTCSPRLGDRSFPGACECHSLQRPLIIQRKNSEDRQSPRCPPRPTRAVTFGSTRHEHRRLSISTAGGSISTTPSPSR